MTDDLGQVASRCRDNFRRFAAAGEFWIYASTGPAQPPLLTVVATRTISERLPRALVVYVEQLPRPGLGTFIIVVPCDQMPAAEMARAIDLHDPDRVEELLVAHRVAVCVRTAATADPHQVHVLVEDFFGVAGNNTRPASHAPDPQAGDLS